MILQITAYVPGIWEVKVLDAPSLDEAAQILDSGIDDRAGNKSFSMGAAVLLPYANRLRGELSSDGTVIATNIRGKHVQLPANWRGKLPRSHRYAMHGLILKSQSDRVEVPNSQTLVGRYSAGDFGGSWPSRTELSFNYSINNNSFNMDVKATNVGNEKLPIGVGWHPYFAIPSGNRRQARLRVPSLKRLEVNNYDEVLPTGKTLSVSATDYDFTAEGAGNSGIFFLMIASWNRSAPLKVG